MIKQFLLSYKENKSKSEIERFVRFEESKNIGILYHKNDFNEDLISFLENELHQSKKHVSKLCFSDKFEKNTDLISPKDISLFGKIKNKKYFDFIDKKFDFLIFISTKENIFLRFLLSQSNATFKAGFDTNFYSKWLNLMISSNTKENADLKNLLEYIKKISP